MNATLVGYFPKRQTPVPDWLADTRAREICSVSECLAPGPPGWIDRWLHNDWGFFNSVSDAWSVVPAENATDFQILAFALTLRLYDAGNARALDIAAPTVEQLPASFTALGYDVPSRSISSGFECSPLSCNGMAREIAVNEHCLLDDIDVALQTARKFSLEQPEPGSYYVVQVLRAR